MSEIAEAFNELFYGAGAWLGLLLLLALIVSLTVKTKYAGVFMLPVTIFLAIDYLDYPALLWNSLIMFFASVFIVINLVKGKDQ